MKRRILSFVLALCFMAGLCVPAWATTTATASRQKITTTLTATVNSTMINVTVPTALPFALDVTKSYAGNKYGQIVAGETFTVTNNSSTVPVYFAVMDIRPASGSDVALVVWANWLDSIEDSIIVDIFREGQEPTWSIGLIGAYGKLLQNSTSATYNVNDRYYLTPSGSPIGVSTSEDFYLGAITGKGFTLYGGQTFDIIVTFVVSAEYTAPVSFGTVTSNETIRRG